MIRSKPLTFYAMAYAGGAALQKGLGFLLFLWLARMLPVPEYARFGMLFALQSGLAQLAGAGIVESVVGLRKTHSSDEARAALLDRANGVFLMMTAAAVAVAVLAYSVVTIDFTPDDAADLGFVLLGGAVTAFITLQATLVRLDERHLASLAATVGGPLAGLFTAFIVFFARNEVGSFYAGMALGLGGALLAMQVMRVGHYGISLSWAETCSLRRRLGPFLAIAFLSWLGGYGNVYLVEAFFNKADVASFTFIYTLSTVMQLVATSTNQVWSPRVFRFAHELPLADLERQNRRFYVMQGAILGAIGAAMLVVVPPLLTFLGGNLAAYRGLDTELFLLLAAYAVTIPWWHSQNFYMAFGEGQALMRIVLGTSLAGLVAMLGLMALFGPIGIYAGFLTQMLLRSLGSLYWAKRRWNLHTAWEGPLVALAMLSLAALGAQMLFSAN